MPDDGQSTELRNALAVDEICDRFEADLQRGETPGIRPLLDEVDADVRPELFQQLLGVQLSMIRKPEDRPGLASLLSEFPEYTDQVLAAYSPGVGPSADPTLIHAAPPTIQEPNVANEAMLSEIQPESRYETGEEVARGGMGAIKLADDVALRRQVAIKSMLVDDATPDELARFIEEAQITGQLDHPGIVPIHELGVDASGQPFYSMKFVRGRDLQTILDGLRKGNREIAEEFTLHRLLNILNRVCDAVAFAHARGVIHRDLKPANIRIGEFGEVMVMDWGLAKIFGKDETRPDVKGRRVESIREDETAGDLRTIAGSVMGSPAYMAPEQASGATHELDEGADIYALGAILYEILTLRPPIEMNSGEMARSSRRVHRRRDRFRMRSPRSR